MCLVFTQMASMVGLWLGLALIIFFAEVVLLHILDHSAGNGGADKANEPNEAAGNAD